jgi:hypothetical protein
MIQIVVTDSTLSQSQSYRNEILFSFFFFLFTLELVRGDFQPAHIMYPGVGGAERTLGF